MGQSPKTEDVMLPILKILKNRRELNYWEMTDRTMVHFGLSKRRYTTAWNSMHHLATLAKRNMLHAGLLQKKQGLFHISNLGLQVLKQRPEKIDHVFLRKFRMNVFPNIPTNTINDKHGDKIARLNNLITRTRGIVMSRQKGAYMSEIRMILGISQEEMSGISERVIRIDGISKRDIRYKGMLLDILFAYSDGTKKTGRIRARPKQHLEAITRQMVRRHKTEKMRVKKHLREELTAEFVKSRSMKKIFSNHPDLAREKIILHVRTNLRLPKRLRQLEQKGAIHPDPDWSLYIALFAVNHYGWDKGKNADHVIWLAQQLAEQMRQFVNTRRKTDFEDSTEMYSDSITTATAVWIATAELHMQYGVDKYFSNKQIVDKTRDLGLLDISYATIAAHVTDHCVANIPATLGNHRKLYRISYGKYRLYRNGDYHNPERRHAEVEPRVANMPNEYRHVLDWYHKTYCKVNPSVKFAI